MSHDDDQIAATVDVVTDVLKDTVVAIYQYGSAVQGGLRPRSDLDVFVVVDRPVENPQRAELASRLLGVSGERQTLDAPRAVEVTIAQLSSLVPWPEHPVREFQFGEWLRADFCSGFLSEQTVDHDLAPLVATLLTASKPLRGPAAATLLEPVPHHALVASMQAGISRLLGELDDDTTNVLLTLCRMAFSTATGEVTSKDEAADWAQAHVGGGDAAPLRQAKEAYLEGAASEAYHHETVMAVARRLADCIIDA